MSRSLVLKAIVLLAAILPVVFGLGQMDHAPVVTATAMMAARAGTEVLLAVAANIPEGWAIQAHVPSLPGLIPTTLVWEPSPGILVGEVVYPKPVPKRLAFLQRTVSVYVGEVVFLVPVRISAEAEPGLRVLRGKLRYQPCTAEYCLFPEEVEVIFKILVVPGHQKI